MCHPVAAQWDLTIKNPKCVDAFAFVYANAAFNIVSDITTLVLPIKMCWTLQTTIRQKVLLLGILGTGSL